jgi:hypothetical protein
VTKLLGKYVGFLVELSFSSSASKPGSAIFCPSPEWPDWENFCPLGDCLLRLVFWKLQSSKHFLARFVHTWSYVLNLSKIGICYILGDSFTNYLIWSPCPSPKCRTAKCHHSNCRPIISSPNLPTPFEPIIPITCGGHLNHAWGYQEGWNEFKTFNHFSTFCLSALRKNWI